MVLTEKQKEILLKASGLEYSNEQFSTYFQEAKDNPDALELVRLGLFDGPNINYMIPQNTAIFVLTAEGIAAAWKVKKEKTKPGFLYYNSRPFEAPGGKILAFNKEAEDWPQPEPPSGTADALAAAFNIHDRIAELEAALLVAKKIVEQSKQVNISLDYNTQMNPGLVDIGTQIEAQKLKEVLAEWEEVIADLRI